MIVLSLLVFVIGLGGFYIEDGGAGFWENAYRAFQLFGGEFPSDINEDKSGLTPLLQIARFAAPAVLTFFVIDFFSSFFTLWVRRVVQMCQAEKRAVILGLGSVGHALAYKLVQDGMRVTAVDHKFDDADRALAEDVGLLLIEGNLAERRVLETARLDKARDVYVTCGRDEVSIEIGALAASILSDLRDRHQGPGTIKTDRSTKTRLHVHLSSTRLVADIGDATDLGFARGKDFETFSLKTAVARDLLARIRLTQRARDFGQNRVHVVLCGLGDHGEALMIEILLTAFADGLGPPCITVLDQDHALAEGRFRACYPRLMDDSLPVEARPTIRFHDADLRVLDMENDALLHDLEHGEDPPTAYIFACGEDLVNLSAALRVETAMQRLQRHAVPIYARLWDHVIGPGDIGADDPLSLVRTFGNARTTTARYLADRQPLEDLAQQLHGAYLSLGGEDQAVPSRARLSEAWDKLPAHGRRANLRAVRQAGVQLISLGLQWRGMQDGTLPCIAADVQDQLQQALKHPNWQVPDADPQNARIVAGARNEHARWMLDRAIEGLRLDPRAAKDPAQAVRDNQRGWHNLMKPFDMLNGPEKDNDLTLLTVLAIACSQKTSEGKPCAYWRIVQRIDPEGDMPTTGDVQGCTELEVTIAARPEPLSLTQWHALRDVILAWSGHETACRLHLRIGAETRFLAPESGARPEPLRPHLGTLLRDIEAEGITVDVSKTPALAPEQDTSRKAEPPVNKASTPIPNDA